jgi:hypothetical protein
VSSPGASQTVGVAELSVGDTMLKRVEKLKYVRWSGRCQKRPDRQFQKILWKRNQKDSEWRIIFNKRHLLRIICKKVI